MSLHSNRSILLATVASAVLSTPALAQFKPPSGQLDATTTVNGTALSTIASQAAAVPNINLGINAFAASYGGVAQRAPADRAADRLNVREYRLASDTDDTAAMGRLQIEAQVLMDMGTSVAIDAPGVLHVTSMPQFQVPRGVDFTFNSAPYGGTEIIVNGASNGIDVAVVVPTTAQQALMPTTSALSRIAVGDFKITKGTSAPAGYDAVRIAGLPNSSGAGLYGATVGRITGAGQGFGGSSTNPWLNVVHMLDQNYFHVRGCVNVYTGPANGEMASGTCVLIETTQSSVTNYSVDEYIDEVTQNGGFAGIQTRGHVEGLHTSNNTMVGSVYGIYSPAYIEIPATSSAAAYVNGVDAIYVTNSHMNTILRGVYAEGADNVQTDGSDYFDSDGNGSGNVLAADAVLPADTAALNPSNALNGYSYVGVDAVNGGNLLVHGSNFEGTGAGYSNAVRFDTAALLGVAAPTSLTGVSITGITANNFRGYQIHIGSAVQYGNIDGNNATNTTTGYDIQSTQVEHSNNTYAGYLYDTGFVNGVENILGNLALSGKALLSYGYALIGGTNRGVLDFQSAGYTGTGHNARIELDATTPGSATGTNDGQLDVRAAQTNVFSPLVATGPIQDHSATRVAIANGATVAAPANSSGVELAPGAAIASGTFSLPAAPADGDTYTIAAEQTITAFSVVPGATGQNVSGGVTTIGASSPVKYKWFAAVATWDRWQ